MELMTGLRNLLKSTSPLGLPLVRYPYGLGCSLRLRTISQTNQATKPMSNSSIGKETKITARRFCCHWHLISVNEHGFGGGGGGTGGLSSCRVRLVCRFTC